MLSFSAMVHAGQSLGSTIDCSDITIDYVDRPDMTRAERLEAMNRAFFESVNRFELCNLSNEIRNSSGASSSANTIGGSSVAGADVAGGESEGAETGENTAGTNTVGSQGNGPGNINSQASALLSGTEAPENLPSAEIDAAETTSSNSSDAEGLAINSSSAGSGALPQDIPPANNDDAVAAQIRLAAEIEKDPVKKEKLWNEYRKYKGLPVKQEASSNDNTIAKETTNDENE